MAACLSANRTFDSYLAGGAAILIEPNTARFSNDLDYFHDSEQRVIEAADEIGCLYYSPSARAFVDPRRAPDAVTHYVRPGGVLPLVLEAE